MLTLVLIEVEVGLLGLNRKSLEMLAKCFTRCEKLRRLVKNSIR